MQQQSDWESQLPLLYVICPSYSPLHINLPEPVFTANGKRPCATNHAITGRRTHSYEHTLTVRLAELRDLVECHITQEAQRQKAFYDSTTKGRTFNVGEAVWLHVPTASKLDARWEGGWTVKEVLSPVNVAVEHTTTARTRVVHVNRHQQRIVRGEVEVHGEEHDQHGVPVAD